MKDAQIDLIRKDLRERGITYGPLFDDLLDHVCTEVEQAMEAGLSFGEAYTRAIEKLEPAGVHTIEERTIKHLNISTLIRNYLLISLRNLWRNRWYTATNLLGLTTGLTACLLIFLFIQYENSFDQSHPENDLWRLYTNRHESNGIASQTAFTGAPWGPAMVEEIPGLKDAARFMKYRLPVQIQVQNTDQTFAEPNLIWADQQALQLFDLPLVQGDQQTALSKPSSIVLSETIAKKYFGTTEAVGKVLSYNNEFDLLVTGVMKDMPDKVHFKADLIGSFSTLGVSFWDIVDRWTILYYYTYFQVDEQADIARLEEDANAFLDRRLGLDWSEKRSVGLQSVKDIYLRSDLENELKANSNINRLYLLAAISAVILLLACANFINLNMARSIKRAREVGVRKVMGSLRWHIIAQFVLESFTLVVLATSLSIMAVWISTPAFNSLLNTNLSLLKSIDPSLIAYLILIILSVSFLAGLFPGLLASRVQTVQALKGKFMGAKRVFSANNAMLLFQFTICAALLIAIGTIRLQQQFISGKDLGYDQGQLLMVSNDGLSLQQYDLVKETVKALPVIEDVSYTSHKLAGDQTYYGGYVFGSPGKAVDTLVLGRLHIDHDFVSTYKTEIVAGRDYDERIVTDTASFLVNEATVRKLGLTNNEEALNYTITYPAQGINGNYVRTGRIIGVIKDFHFQTLHHEIEAFVMDIQPARYHFYACRVNTEDYKQVAQEVLDAINGVAPNASPDLFWLDETQVSLYEAEATFSKLISIAVLISILLSLKGLLSLVLQLVASSRREVGIRKVLGASVTGIITLFSARFFTTIILSFLIAWPVVYWWMNNWLQQFPYRIEVPWLLYLAGPAVLLILAFITIAGSTIKVAVTSPAKSLRYD